MPTDTLTTRRGVLASALQEILTVTVRLRANRQAVPDAESFRAQAKQLLATAQEQSRRAGYPDQDINLALYATVAFLDESVLNATQPSLSDWSRRPLQDEIFGGHVGGELFFRNVEALLAQADSDDAADVLEIYQLCLLLGFRGRYGARGTGSEIDALTHRVGEKITRIRGAQGPLSPSWAPTAPVRSTVQDPWLLRLSMLAGTITALALLLFIVFTISLRSRVSDVRALAGATSQASTNSVPNTP